MNATIFLTPNERGITRAKVDPNGLWVIDVLLEGKDVRCLAGDPNNPDVVYAGTQGQGVFRSNDGGSSWIASGMKSQIVKSLAVSPHDSRKIFAGTKPAYMYLSTDVGQSWDELTGFRHIPGRWWWFSPAESPYQAYVQAIAPSPSDPDVILAGIEFGAVVRSQDGGKTWSGHRKGALRDCHALKFHPSSGNWAYEAGGTGGGASYSQDGGMTWHKQKDGLAKHYGVSCSADPVNPKIWYVAVAPGPSKAYGKNAEVFLYRSSDGGKWQPIGWEPHPMNRMPIALKTDPNQPGHLYAGLTNGDVWFSTDYGDSWEKMLFNLGSISQTMIIISR